jgi:acetylornithine deacetylase/succinyl-diaminopimelate desuccinylase-like protein
MLCGHVDVVSIGQKAGWKVKPFRGAIEDGRLYGQGSCEMKGAVAAYIAAARTIRKAGIALVGRLSIHTVVDKEVGGFGAMDAVAKGRTAKAAIIAEPRGQIVTSEGGLYWVRVTIRERQAHAGRRFNEIWPQHQAPGRLAAGVNAVDLAMRFLNGVARLREHPLPHDKPSARSRGSQLYQSGRGESRGGARRSRTTNDHGQSCDHPGCRGHRSRLQVPSELERRRGAQGIRELRPPFCEQDRWLREHPIAIKWALGGLFFPPMDTSPNHPLVASLMRRAGELGERASVEGFNAVTNAAHYSGAGIAPLIFGPSGDGRAWC